MKRRFRYCLGLMYCNVCNNEVGSGSYIFQFTKDKKWCECSDDDYKKEGL